MHPAQGSRARGRIRQLHNVHGSPGARRKQARAKQAAACRRTGLETAVLTCKNGSNAVRMGCRKLTVTRLGQTSARATSEVATALQAFCMLMMPPAERSGAAAAAAAAASAPACTAAHWVAHKVRTAGLGSCLQWQVGPQAAVLSRPWRSGSIKVCAHCSRDPCTPLTRAAEGHTAQLLLQTCRVRCSRTCPTAEPLSGTIRLVPGSECRHPQPGCADVWQPQPGWG